MSAQASTHGAEMLVWNSRKTKEQTADKRNWGPSSHPGSHSGCWNSTQLSPCGSDPSGLEEKPPLNQWFDTDDVLCFAVLASKPERGRQTRRAAREEWRALWSGCNMSAWRMKGKIKGGITSAALSSVGPEQINQQLLAVRAAAAGRWAADRQRASGSVLTQHF